MTHTRPNHLDTNYKAESIASALVALGLEPNKVMIFRHKGDKRLIYKDIDKLQHLSDDTDRLDSLYIYTNRESIYDTLPEGLFHRISFNRKQTTKDTILQDIKEQREKEKQIRRFFQPFEMVLDSMLIETQSQERKFDKIHLYDNLSQVIREHWNIFQFLSTRQSLLFLKLIPILPESSTNFQLMANIMSVMLDSPVKVQEYHKTQLTIKDTKEVQLKQWKLGVNSVLGTLLQSGTRDLLITIGTITLEQMRLFEYGETNYRILEELIQMIVPFDRNTQVKYLIIQEETSFHLSDKNHTAYLGINTCL